MGFCGSTKMYINNNINTYNVVLQMHENLQKNQMQVMWIQLKTV